LFGVLVVFGIGLTLALGILLRGHAPAPPLDVQIQGVSRAVPAGTALKDVIQQYGLVPGAGDLLDVEGVVLVRGKYQGRVLLNGVAVPGDTALSQGDVVTLQRGKDHTEKIVRKVMVVSGGEVPNPQFFLGKAPGEQISRFGKISGKFVSSTFHPTASFQPPKAVALTFDDGPSPENTLKVLRVLQKYGVKATFFVIGRSAEFHPNLIRAELAAGMEVGDHSWSHPYRTPFKTLPTRTIRDEITLAQHELLTLGTSSGLFRPPGGTFSPRVIDIAKQADMRLVMWSIDPKDWMRGRTASQITQAVLSKVSAGDIIVLHDGGGNRSATIRALPSIIKGIRAKGLQIVTISQGSA
jgi:peptidoglycan-N-acetylglucosamine deacetylase